MSAPESPRALCAAFPLTRREAVALTAAVVGGALVGCGREREAGRAAVVERLVPEDVALLEAVADTLLPTTAASPGARAAGAGAGMALLLDDCYEPEARQRVVRGLGELRGLCRTRCASGFAALAPAEREAIVRELDAAAVRAGDAHWFTLVREVALRAYFSSEVGMTRALRYERVPGRWIGCVPLEPGQPAWG